MTLTDFQKKLVEDNIEYAASVVRYGMKRKGWPNRYEDDMLSFGRIGLIQAAIHFDPTKGKFRTFAYRRIIGAVQDGLRDEIDFLPSRSRERMTKRGEEPPQLFTLLAAENYKHTSTSVSHEVDLRDWWENLQSFLRRDTVAILDGIYFKNQTFKEIGKTLGVSESRVSQKLKEALPFIRGLMHAKETGKKFDIKTDKIYIKRQPVYKKVPAPVVPPAPLAPLSGLDSAMDNLGSALVKEEHIVSLKPSKLGCGLFAQPHNENIMNTQDPEEFAELFCGEHGSSIFETAVQNLKARDTIIKKQVLDELLNFIKQRADFIKESAELPHTDDDDIILTTTTIVYDELAEYLKSKYPV